MTKRAKGILLAATLLVLPVGPAQAAEPTSTEDAPYQCVWVPPQPSQPTRAAVCVFWDWGNEIVGVHYCLTETQCDQPVWNRIGVCKPDATHPTPYVCPIQGQ